MALSNQANSSDRDNATGTLIGNPFIPTGIVTKVSSCKVVSDPRFPIHGDQFLLHQLFSMPTLNGAEAMNLNKRNVVVGLAFTLVANWAMGQIDVALTTSISGDGITAVTGTGGQAHRSATGASGGYTFDLFLDSAADILVIDATLTVCAGQIFNDTDPSHAATDHAPPIPALMNVFGDLNADLWVTTPGGTTAADASNLAAGDTVSHFDTTDDGPQSGFHWASLTLVPEEIGAAYMRLDATIQTAATPTPMFSDVTVEMFRISLDENREPIECAPVPEPNSFGLMVTALFGGLAFVRRGRNGPYNMRFRKVHEQ